MVNLFLLPFLISLRSTDQFIFEDSLFPYAFENVLRYITDHFDEVDVQKVILELRSLAVDQSKTDSNVRIIRTEKLECIEDVTYNVRYWIKLDKKFTPMKTLQGLIWEEAYERGDVKGHVYPDVLPVLEKLNVPIFIYSSGSVHAQKLLFSHSINGDMTKIISGYFDTNIGLKGDSDSYLKICKAIKMNPTDVLFLTDVEAEARAARISGLQSKIIVRNGNAPLSDDAKRDFDAIELLDAIL
uniref:2,3-diketo-5-methylthio-1-phosphopentane phosphatase n=1 Tax=Heterorhabditis bacteriophora TaxID=37862 RepID=A0A1I7X3G4_HETBA